MQNLSGSRTLIACGSSHFHAGNLQYHWRITISQCAILSEIATYENALIEMLLRCRSSGEACRSCSVRHVHCCRYARRMQGGHDRQIKLDLKCPAAQVLRASSRGAGLLLATPVPADGEAAVEGCQHCRAVHGETACFKREKRKLCQHCTERQRHKRSPASCPSVRHSKTRSVSAKRQQKYKTGFKHATAHLSGWSVQPP